MLGFPRWPLCLLPLSEQELSVTVGEQICIFLLDANTTLSTSNPTVKLENWSWNNYYSTAGGILN